MNREMKKKEIDAFKEKYGYEPTNLVCAIDMVSVFVHKDNPIKGLTLAQLDAIYSRTRKSGHKEVRTWGDLGLDGEWAEKPIRICGRNSVSAKYSYFKERVLGNGDFKDEVKELPGAGALADSVGSNRFAIGYDHFAYKPGEVKAVPLATKAGEVFVAPEPEKARSGEY